MSSTTTTAHANRIAELTADLDDFLFVLPGNGNVKVTTTDGQSIYTIIGGLTDGHTPEAISRVIWG